MVQSVMLSQADVKEILADYFKVNVKNIISTRYSYVVADADISKLQALKGEINVEHGGKKLQ